jgi:carboxymethylenebutenolidase
MNAALMAAGGQSMIRLFPAADHGFLADYRPSFNPSASEQAWAMALGWLGKDRQA